MNFEPAFYKALEDRFRGDSTELSTKFKVYDPLLELLEDTVDPVALDLGCGRGEWLARLLSRGWSVYGVDCDETMCDTARANGVSVTSGDLFDFLQGQASHSVDLITAFHVIEHIAVDQLLTLMHQARRVLKPHGCLLLETPNPENLQVGSNLFYLDPTHQKPLSPELPQFMAHWVGFQCAAVLRIHSPSHYSEDGLLGDQFETFLRYSPDYALIASEDSRFSDISASLAGDLGPSDVRFFDQANRLHQNLKATDHWLATECQRIEDLSIEQQTQINQLSEQLRHLRACSIGFRLASIWRVFRRAVGFIKGGLNGILSKALRWPMARLASIVVRRPWLKRVAVQILHRVPALARLVGRTLATERSAVGHIGIDGVRWSSGSVVLLNTLEQELFAQLTSDSD